MIKKLLAALGAVGGVLLGLQSIGVTPVAPGYDTGFHRSAACADAQGLCFSTDAGDLSVLATLRVHAPEADSAAGWQAMLTNGAALAVAADRVANGTWRLRIEKPDSSLRLSKFKWPSGVALQVWHRHPGSIRLEDWEVSPENASYDSRSRASWRTVWFWLLLGLLGIGLVSVVWDQLGKKPEELSVQALIAQLVRRTILEVQGDSDEETRKIRELLGKVLLGSVPVVEALREVEPESQGPRRQALFFKARARFLAHLDKLQQIFDTYRILLR